VTVWRERTRSVTVGFQPPGVPPAPRARAGLRPSRLLDPRPGQSSRSGQSSRHQISVTRTHGVSSRFGRRSGRFSARVSRRLGLERCRCVSVVALRDEAESNEFESVEPVCTDSEEHEYRDGGEPDRLRAEDEPRYTRQHERTKGRRRARCVRTRAPTQRDEQDEDERGFHEHDGAQRAPRRNDCHERDVAGRQRTAVRVCIRRARSRALRAGRAGRRRHRRRRRARRGRRRSASPGRSRPGPSRCGRSCVPPLDLDRPASRTADSRSAGPTSRAVTPSSFGRVRDGIPRTRDTGRRPARDPRAHPARRAPRVRAGP